VANFRGRQVPRGAQRKMSVYKLRPHTPQPTTWIDVVAAIWIAKRTELEPRTIVHVPGSSRALHSCTRACGDRASVVRQRSPCSSRHTGTGTEAGRSVPRDVRSPIQTNQRYDLTLLATGASETAAELVAVCHRALRLAPSMCGLIAPHRLLVDTACKRAGRFDVMRFHTECCPLALFNQQHALFIAGMHESLEE